MANTRISVETRGALELIGLDRAAKKNAFDSTMLREFFAAYTRAEDDPAVRCLVVFAHGGDFTAGLDLMEVAPFITQGGLSIVDESQVDPWSIRGRQRTKPVITAVQGRCLTLGIELLLASDIRIAASDTRFGQIEIKRGIFPFGGATFRMPDQCGWGNAMRWLLTGDEFDAKEALRIGLVQEVVHPGNQLERAIQIAETVATQAPLGVRATMDSARLGQSHQQIAAALVPTLIELMKSDDAREGLMSFVERRTAKFSGK